MAQRPLTQQDLQAIRELAKGWGKIVARRAFGDDGPDLDTDLDALEQLALAAAQGLAAGTLEEATCRQAPRLGAQQPCPGCGRPCLVSPEPRQVHTRACPFHHREPAAHCPDCRRDFFPPTAGSAPG